MNRQDIINEINNFNSLNNKELRDEKFKDFIKKYFSFYKLTEKGEIITDKLLQQYLTGIKLNNNALFKFFILISLRMVTNSPENTDIVEELSKELGLNTPCNLSQLIYDNLEKFTGLIIKNPNHFELDEELYQLLKGLQK